MEYKSPGVLAFNRSAQKYLRECSEPREEKTLLLKVQAVLNLEIEEASGRSDEVLWAVRELSQYVERELCLSADLDSDSADDLAASMIYLLYRRGNAIRLEASQCIVKCCMASRSLACAFLEHGVIDVICDILRRGMFQLREPFIMLLAQLVTVDCSVFTMICSQFQLLELATLSMANKGSRVEFSRLLYNATEWPLAESSQDLIVIAISRFVEIEFAECYCLLCWTLVRLCEVEAFDIGRLLRLHLDAFLCLCISERIDHTIGPGYLALARIVRSGRIVQVDHKLLIPDASDFRKPQRCKNAISLIEAILDVSEADLDTFSAAENWDALLQSADALPFPVAMSACAMFAGIISASSDLLNVMELLEAGVAPLFVNVLASCDDPLLIQKILRALSNSIRLHSHTHPTIPWNLRNAFPPDIFCELTGLSLLELFDTISTEFGSRYIRIGC
jgi:hypothetical protein